jgi:hypothetical protein
VGTDLGRISGGHDASGCSALDEPRRPNILGTITGAALSVTNVPRPRLLISLVLLWWLPSSAFASTLELEHSLVRDGLTLSDESGKAIALTDVAIAAVVDGPWVTTTVELEYQDNGLPVTLEVPLPAQALHLDPVFAPALKSSEGNTCLMELEGYTGHASFTYVQEVTQSRVVLLPLAGHGELRQLSVRATNQLGQPVAEPLDVEGQSAVGDVVVHLDQPEAAARARELVSIPLRVTGTEKPYPLANVLYLVDTSASTYRSVEQLKELLRVLLSRSTGQVGVVTFDQDVETLYLGSAAGVEARVLAQLAERGAAGATDLERALRAVSGLVKQGPFRRVVLLSDGMSTLGSQQTTTLKRVIAQWPSLGLHRFDAVTASHSQDDALLAQLTTAGLREDGVVVAADNTAPSLSRLERHTLPAQAVTVIGSTAQSPKVLRGRQAGDLVWIHAKVPEGLPVAVRVGARPPRTWATTEAYYPLLARVLPSHGIVVRNELKPGVLGEQLEVRGGKLESIEIRNRSPRVFFGCTYVTGRLPPETVQTIVRNNFGRFRGCYAKVLRTKPEISGRVVVRFVIGPVGHVTSVQDDGSTFPDRPTIGCIMEAFSQIEFPIPAGGSVNVVYPLLLSPEGTEAKPTEAKALAPRRPVELPDPLYPLRPREVGEEAFTGDYALLRGALRQERWADARSALESLERQPTQELTSVLARGSFAEATGDTRGAGRAYGSLVDLFLHSSEVRRLAAAHWARLGDARASDWAIDALTKVIAAQKESAAGQRQLAWTWVLRGDYRRGLDLLIQTLQARSPEEGSELKELLLQDVALVARATIASAPARQAEVSSQLRRLGVELPTAGSLRFLLVPLQGDGLSLGLYPELAKGRLQGVERWFGQYQVINVADSERKSPYRIHGRNLPDRFRAPDGPAFGYVEIVDQDSSGALVVDYRPFIFQNTRSEVDLGTYGKGEPSQGDAPPPQPSKSP